jgi:predicted MFS family arabinose efflux permease
VYARFDTRGRLDSKSASAYKLTMTTAQSPSERDPTLVAIFPLMIIYAVGFMSATYLPVWVVAAAHRYAVPAATIGLIGSYELGTIALATILCAAFRTPGPSRTPLTIALLLSIGFNLLTALAQSLELFTAALLLSGLANGFLLAEVNGRAAASSAANRIFAGQLFVMMSCAVIFFAVAPRVLVSWGAGAPFFFCAGAGVLALLSLPKLEHSGLQVAAAAAKPGFKLLPSGILLLAAPTLLFVSMNVIWPFIGPEAARAGVSLATYSRALSVGALINLSGPILAHRLLKSAVSRLMLLTVGIVAFLACTVSITAIAAAGAFIIGVMMLPFFLLVVVPFYLVELLASDPSGKYVAVTPAFFMIGTAIGPALGGLALHGFGLSGVALASMAAPVLALLATLSGGVRVARAAR